MDHVAEEEAREAEAEAEARGAAAGAGLRELIAAWGAPDLGKVRVRVKLLASGRAVACVVPLCEKGHKHGFVDGLIEGLVVMWVQNMLF
jgi:hypothetical protein